MPDQTRDRFRNFSFLVYRDSAPDNWIDIIDKWHTKTLISPEHCEDISESGEILKPHWHVMMCFPGNKNPNVLMPLLEELHSPPHIEVVHDVKGMTVYFFHSDDKSKKNPRKTEYSIDQGIVLNGFDLEKNLQIDSSVYIEEILSIIDQYKVESFRQLVYRIRGNNKLIGWVVKYAYFFHTFLERS